MYYQSEKRYCKLPSGRDRHCHIRGVARGVGAAPPPNLADQLTLYKPDYAPRIQKAIYTSAHPRSVIWSVSEVVIKRFFKPLKLKVILCDCLAPPRLKKVTNALYF